MDFFLKIKKMYPSTLSPCPIYIVAILNGLRDYSGKGAQPQYSLMNAEYDLPQKTQNSQEKSDDSVISKKKFHPIL